MKNVLVVGHCGVDGPRIEEFVQSLKLNVKRPAGEAELEQCIDEGPCVLLVNRELVGEYDCDSGIELIKKLKSNRPDVVAVLVSDKADAQTKARQAGAEAGFGKSKLDADETAELIRKLAC